MEPCIHNNAESYIYVGSIYICDTYVVCWVLQHFMVIQTSYTPTLYYNVHTMLRLTSHIYVYCMEIVYIVNVYKQVCLYVVTYRDDPHTLWSKPYKYIYYVYVEHTYNMVALLIKLLPPI